MRNKVRSHIDFVAVLHHQCVVGRTWPIGFREVGIAACPPFPNADLADDEWIIRKSPNIFKYSDVMAGNIPD